MNRIASCFLYLVDRLKGKQGRALFIHPKKMQLNDVAKLYEEGAMVTSFDNHTTNRLPIKLTDRTYYGKINRWSWFLSGKIGY